jgi:hypothetical protein
MNAAAHRLGPGQWRRAAVAGRERAARRVVHPQCLAVARPAHRRDDRRDVLPGRPPHAACGTDRLDQCPVDQRAATAPRQCPSPLRAGQDGDAQQGTRRTGGRDPEFARGPQLRKARRRLTDGRNLIGPRPLTVRPDIRLGLGRVLPKEHRVRIVPMRPQWSASSAAPGPCVGSPVSFRHFEWRRAPPRPERACIGM